MDLRKLATKPSVPWLAIVVALCTGCSAVGPPHEALSSDPGSLRPDATQSVSATPAAIPSPETLPAGTVVTGLAPDVVSDTHGIWAYGTELAFESAEQVVIFDTRAADVVATVPLPDVPQINGVLLTTDSVWILDHDNGRVIRLDRATGEEVATIELGGKAVHMVEGDQGIWAGSGHVYPESVGLIDTETNQITRRLELGAFPTHANGSLWFGRNERNQDGVVRQVDEATGEVLASIELGSADGCYLGGSFPDAVWGWCFDPPPDDTQLTRIDVARGEVAGVITLDGGGGLMGVHGHRSWFFSDGPLLEVSNASNAIERSYAVPPDQPSAMVDGVLWLLDRGRGTLTKHDLSGGG